MPTTEVPAEDAQSVKVETLIVCEACHKSLAPTLVGNVDRRD